MSDSMQTSVLSPLAGHSEREGSKFHDMLTNLRPIFEMDQLVTTTLQDMGFEDVAATSEIDPNAKIDFSVLHFVILPHKSAWLDFLLETDRPSAAKLLETMSGITEAADEDLEDVLRETMNLIHGTVKSAFKKDVIDVIIPVVPQSIATEKLVGMSGGISLRSRFVFRTAGLFLRLTIVARVAPITRKQLRELRLASVLIDPLSTEGDHRLVLVKPHTMLNERQLEKAHNLADMESNQRTLPVIEPSPLASLLPHS